MIRELCSINELFVNENHEDVTCNAFADLDDFDNLCDTPVTSTGFSIIKNFIMPVLHGALIARAKQVSQTLPV